MSSTRRDGGGTAMAGGARFEVLVGAWLLAHVLAEENASWMPDGCKVMHVRGNTGQPVDDYLVATQGHLGLGWSFVQVKRSLSHSDGAGSQYAGLIDQLVKQYWSWGQGSADTNWERPLTVGKDALLLVTRSASSSRITATLPAVLTRAKSWPEIEDLDRVPRNDTEASVWCAFKAHVGRTWAAVSDSALGREELQEMAGLAAVKPLTLESGGASFDACQQLLARSLADVSQTHDAWNLLYDLSTRMSADSAGFDRKSVVRELTGSGIHLRGKPSFEPQRQQLRRISERAMGDLRRFARIEVAGEGELWLDRPVSHAAKELVESGQHFLITGEPGAGKSGVLAGLAADLGRAGESVLLLSADTAAYELDQLGGSANDVIVDWSASSRGWLLIDAIDAVREPGAAAALKQLMRQVVTSNGFWTVVATCRVFDLRHGSDLQHLFRGQPHADFHSSEFPRIRHVHVTRLTGQELEQVAVKSPTLSPYLAAASDSLREVLSVPFHLWILADLIDFIEPSALAGIEGKFALMREYWKYRVAFTGQRDAREAVLRVVCDNMVENHRLHCDRSDLASVDPSTMEGLQHDEVLVPRQGPEDHAWLKFSHHALYDFAVARLVVAPRLGEIAAWLGEDRTRALSVRPSFVLVVEEAWGTADQFWRIALELSADEIPAVLRLIPAEVLASHVTSARELEALREMLTEADAPSRRCGARLLDGARTALQAKGSKQVIRPWLEVAHACTAAGLTRDTLGAIESLNWYAFRLQGDAEPRSSDLIHSISVGILVFGLDEDLRSSVLLRRSIDVLAGTIVGQDPGPANAVLERLLEPERLASHGFMYVSRLGQAMTGPMYSLLPDLVELAYLRVFGVEPAEDGPVPMGRLPAIQSNMGQDYQMGRWALGQNAKAFALACPSHATRAMLDVLWSYATANHRLDLDSDPEEFQVQGRPAHLIEDLSYIWDSGTYSHRDAMVVVQAWEDALRHALDTGDENKWVEAIKLFVERNRLAIGWSRVLRVLRNTPDAFEGLSGALGATPALLSSPSAHTEAGKTLVAIHGVSDEAIRAQLERVVLELPERAEGEGKRAWLNEARNRIITSIPGDRVVTQPATALRTSLESNGAQRGLEPLSSMGSMTSSPFTWRESLEEQGVDLSAEPAAVTALEAVEAFQSTHRNQQPSKAEVESGLTSFRVLQRELDGDQVDQRLRENALAYLAEACAVLADSEHLEDTGGGVDFVDGVLLEAASKDRPEAVPEQESQFARGPSWGMPNAQVSAARGLLPMIVRRGPSAARLDAVERLSQDPAPAVRFHIAVSSNVIYDVARDEMWVLLERFLLTESNPAVVQAAVTGPVRRLLHHHEDRCIELLIGAWERSATWNHDELDGALCRPLLDTHLYWGRADAADALEAWIATPWTRPGAFNALLSSTLDAVRTPDHGGRRAAETVRTSAMSLLTLAIKNLASYVGALPWTAPEPESEALEEMRDAARLIESVARSLRFFVGPGRRDSPELDAATAKWFAGELRPLVDSLMVLPAVSIAHLLVETLAALADYEPREVFLLLHIVVCSASDKDRYHQEALAAEEVVKLVQRYLADYGEVFNEHDCKLALVDVLDRFADWPQAQPLLHQLDELFR